MKAGTYGMAVAQTVRERAVFVAGTTRTATTVRPRNTAEQVLVKAGNDDTGRAALTERKRTTTDSLSVPVVSIDATVVPGVIVPVISLPLSDV
jgi:hypothetical protein